jgi:hypothetical protein
MHDKTYASRARVTNAQACRTARLGSVFLRCAEQRRAASGAAVTWNVTGIRLIVVVFTVWQECAALGLTKPNGSIFNKNKDRKVRRVPLMSRVARHTLQAMIQALSFHHGSVNGAAADGADGSVYATQQQVTRVVWRGARPSPCELIFVTCSCCFRRTRPSWSTFDARAFAWHSHFVIYDWHTLLNNK